MHTTIIHTSKFSSNQGQCADARALLYLALNPLVDVDVKVVLLDLRWRLLLKENISC
jgi:hypothetical protein